MRLGENEPCWCGSGKKYKRCHQRFDAQLAELLRKGHAVPSRKLIKTPEQVEGIRKSGAVNGAVLDEAARRISPGITTGELDRIVRRETAALGGVPAPLNYEGFPCAVCVSINEEVCHGIPSGDTVLREGDIVNVDASTIYEGYYSDASRMFCVGEVSRERRRLVQTALDCMLAGVGQVRPWGFLGDVGAAVAAVARKNGFSVVAEVGGHGVGLAFHEEPWVCYVTKAGSGMVLAPGMVFTVEPMINQGKARIRMSRNGWTVLTADGLPSAQWEVTVAVTETGCEVLAR